MQHILTVLSSCTITSIKGPVLRRVHSVAVFTERCVCVCCRGNSSELIPCQEPTIITLRPVNTADDTRFCSLSPFSGLAFFHSLLSALVSIFILVHPNYLSSSLSPSSRSGRGFSHPSRPAGPGAHPASYIMGTGSFPVVKRPGRGVADSSI
jgi:hypothetical protein